MPDRPDFFRCPICRSVRCEQVVIKRGADRADYPLPLYACSTCTVVFGDPIAFTRGFEDRPRSAASTGNARDRAYVAWGKINQARKDRGG